MFTPRFFQSSAARANERALTHDGMVAQKLSRFCSVVDSLGKKIPGNCQLDVGSLIKFISRDVSENPSQTSSSVKKTITKNCIVLEDQSLIYGMGITSSSKATYQGLLRKTSLRAKPFILVEGKISYRDGPVCEGRFEYCPKSKTSQLVEGKQSFPNGEVHEGRFKYIPEADSPKLVEGKVTLPDGRTREIKFTYHAESDTNPLLQGKISLSDGRVEEGLFEYSPELKDYKLVKGTITHPNGLVEDGRFKFIPELGRNELLYGRRERGENWQEGTRSYISELGRMHLTEGVINKNGVANTGKWVYDQNLANGAGGMLFDARPAAPVEIPAAQKRVNSDLIATITYMTNTFGNNKAVTNLENLVNAWESLNQTTTNQGYVEEVTQLSDVYHQCKRTLFNCVHPDKDGTTELAQKHLEEVQNLGRSINNAVDTLRNSEPSFF